jgi:chromosome segregation ATPase
MRRLLDEAEGLEAGRIKEAREKLDIAIEERDHLEEEIALLRRNNAEGSGELTKALREKELEVKDLSNKYEIARHDVEELTKKNADVQARLLQARKESDEATLKLNKLSKSLV